MKYFRTYLLTLLVASALAAVAQNLPQQTTDAIRVQEANAPHTQAPGPITLAVDATDAPRRILHARMTIPVTPGEFTLVYPEWIPGEHGPTGPIDDLTGLRFTAGGQAL